VFEIRGSSDAAVAKAGRGKTQRIYCNNKGEFLSPEDIRNNREAGYYITYNPDPDTTVQWYHEKQSNYYDTSEINQYNFTSKLSETYSVTFQGNVGFPIDTATVNFSFSYQHSVTCEVSNQTSGPINPGQWVTGTYGAWMNLRYGDSYWHDDNGTDTLVAADFQIWTPMAGNAVGWVTSNNAP
jgi:hypothetical protein